MESIDDSLKSICRRVKKSLKLLHGVDTCKPVDGGINESGFKALFQGALAEDNYHVESEFKLGGQYCDLLLTRRDAPFDVAIVLDLKYCATPFIASKHFDNAQHDPQQLEALKKLNVLDICKLKMFWSKGYEAVSVKTVLVAAKVSQGEEEGRKAAVPAALKDQAPRAFDWLECFALVVSDLVVSFCSLFSLV